MDFEDMTHMQSKDLFSVQVLLWTICVCCHSSLWSQLSREDCRPWWRCPCHWTPVPESLTLCPTSVDPGHSRCWMRDRGEKGWGGERRGQILRRWRWHVPRYWHSGHSVPLALRLHVLQAASQAVVGRLVARFFLCDLQHDRGTSIWNARVWHNRGENMVHIYQVVDDSFLPSQNSTLSGELICLETNHRAVKWCDDLACIMQKKTQK